MVDVDGGTLPADSQLKSVDLVWGLAATKWTSHRASRSTCWHFVFGAICICSV